MEKKRPNTSFLTLLDTTIHSILHRANNLFLFLVIDSPNEYCLCNGQNRDEYRQIEIRNDLDIRHLSSDALREGISWMWRRSTSFPGLTDLTDMCNMRLQPFLQHLKRDMYTISFQIKSKRVDLWMEWVRKGGWMMERVKLWSTLRDRTRFKETNRKQCNYNFSIFTARLFRPNSINDYHY